MAQEKKNESWITQQQLANELNITIQRVNNWVARKKVDSKLLPPSSTIVVNKYSIKIKKFSSFFV